MVRSSVVVLALLALAGCGQQADGTGGPPGPLTENATVAGTVTLGPQCPVESADEPCPAVPPAGVTVTVAERLPGEAYAAGPTVATGTTDVDGRFSIGVPAGEYVVTADAGMSCELMDVVAVAGERADVEVPCDTGIR